MKPIDAKTETAFEKAGHDTSLRLSAAAVAFAKRVRVNQLKLGTEIKPQYEFIVCGSSTSESVVARRLSHDSVRHGDHSDYVVARSVLAKFGAAATRAQLSVGHFIVKEDHAVVELHSGATAKNRMRCDNRYCRVVYFSDNV